MKKNPDKLTPVSIHITTQEPDEVVSLPPPLPGSIPEGRQPIHRLSFTEGRPLRYTTDRLYQQVLESPPHTVFFVDANVFFNEVHHKTWEALVQRRVAVTPLVFQELQHSWIANPSANTHIHQLVVDWVRDRESPVFELFQPDPTNEVISKAVPYYMALLIARKLLWGFVSDQFLEKRGSQPTDAEVEGTIRRCFGERGYQRAKKGRESLGSVTFAADEQLVLYAFLHALLFGTETVILSGDKDIEDQFYKMQWLLDTHYRSMLFAEKWAKGEVDLPSQSLDIAGGLSRAFQGNDAIVVTGRSANLHEVLPERFTPSILYNWLVTGPAENLRMYPISLCLEQEMRRVLWMKAKTGGSNTDAMNGRNCHVWQKPLSFPGGCVVFAQDILCTGGGVVVPVLDWQHALMTDERISHIHVEDGEGMSITAE